MQVEAINYKGEVWRVGDRVKYTPNHVDCDVHPDIEYGRISSIRVTQASNSLLSRLGHKKSMKVVGVSMWVRYDNMHPSQPGQNTPMHNLTLL